MGQRVAARKLRTGQAAMSSIPRYLLFPCLFVLAQWWLYLAPGAASLLPALWAVDEASDARAAPLVPRTRLEAYDLGRVAGRFDACAEDDDACRDECLSAAAAAIGRKEPFAREELEHAREAIAALDGRAQGFFSFVNIVWLCAVMGIVGTVGPFVAYVFGEAIVKLGRKFKNKVIVPLHEAGVLEALAYVVALLFSAQGLRYPAGQVAAGRMAGYPCGRRRIVLPVRPEPDRSLPTAIDGRRRDGRSASSPRRRRDRSFSSTQVATTGAALFLPCLGYSTSRHVDPSVKGDKRVLSGVLAFLTAFELAPQALAHDSALLGFYTVAAAYGGLGLHMGAFFGGYYVGFESRRPGGNQTSPHGISSSWPHRDPFPRNIHVVAAAAP